MNAKMGNVNVSRSVLVNVTKVHSHYGDFREVIYISISMLYIYCYTCNTGGNEGSTGGMVPKIPSKFYYLITRRIRSVRKENRKNKKILWAQHVMTAAS